MAKQLIPGNNAISIDNNGWVLFKRPHGRFYSMTTQAIANTAVNTQVLTYEKITDVEGLGFTIGDSKIYVPTSGSYMITFTGTANISGSSNKRINVWLKVDGSTINETNKMEFIPTTTTYATITASFIVDLNVGQYVEMGTWGDATQCQWIATTGLTGPTRPDCPSVVTTVVKVSSKLSYE